MKDEWKADGTHFTIRHSPAYPPACGPSLPLFLRQLFHCLDRERGPKAVHLGMDGRAVRVTARHAAIERAEGVTSAPQRTRGPKARANRVDRGLLPELGVVGRVPPVLHPFPDVSVHIVQAERI